MNVRTENQKFIVLRYRTREIMRIKRRLCKSSVLDYLAAEIGGIISWIR